MTDLEYMQIVNIIRQNASRKSFRHAILLIIIGTVFTVLSGICLLCQLLPIRDCDILCFFGVSLVFINAAIHFLVNLPIYRKMELQLRELQDASGFPESQRREVDLTTLKSMKEFFWPKELWVYSKD